MKRIIILLVLVAFGLITKSTAQDIEPMPLPGPATSSPLSTSITTEPNEYSPTTLKDAEDTSPSSDYTETTQSETTTDYKIVTTDIPITTENANSGTTGEDISEMSTDTTEVATSTTENPEDTTTNAIKTSTEDIKTTALIPEEPTSTTVRTSTEDNTTIGPTTALTPNVPTITTTSPPTQRPSDKPSGNSPVICRLVLQDGNAYYNWIFRVIIVPKECFFCCRIGFYALEQCTQINPFFCSC